MTPAQSDLSLFPIPILRIFDITKALDFYAGFLGFEEDWRHETPGGGPHYLQMSRNGMQLHLTEHHGDCTPGSTVFVRVGDVRALHREIDGKDYPFNRPGLQKAPWGGMVFETTDPFGNRLRFWGE